MVDRESGLHTVLGYTVRDNLLTIAILAGLAVVIMKWPRLWRFLRFPSSSIWPTMPAIVEQVVVHSYSGRNGTTYRAEVVYSYQVSGEYYAGRQMGDLVSSEGELDDIVGQYPKGTTVQIRVHPAKPRLSVLSP